MQELLIEKIRTDGGVQSRERISDEYVVELAELIKAGKKLPPVDVYSDGTDIWAADGFHRILAHIKADKRTVRCNVHKGTKADAMWASCAANQEHGLRRTNADKRHAVEMALKINGGKSDRAIADHVGVSDPFVSGLRRQVLTVSTCERVGRDGKTYRVPPPPPGGERTETGGEERTERTKRVEIEGEKRPSPPPSPLNGEGEERKRKTPPPPPAMRPLKNDRLDEVGQVIPDHLERLFDRAGEVQALLSKISGIRGVLRTAQEDGDVLYGDVNWQSVEAALQTAYSDLKATIPHAVCPWCHGTLTDHCKGCGKRGVVGQFRWDTTVPREMKP
ncbi:MAG: hypothetical protein WCL49_12695 [bacterium]